MNKQFNEIYDSIFLLFIEVFKSSIYFFVLLTTSVFP